MTIQSIEPQRIQGVESALDPKLRDAACGLESLFTRHLLGHLGKGLPGVPAGAAGGETYAMLFQEALVDSLAGRGDLGLSAQICEQLRRDWKPSDKSSVTSS